MSASCCVLFHSFVVCVLEYDSKLASVCLSVATERAGHKFKIVKFNFYFTFSYYCFPSV